MGNRLSWCWPLWNGLPLFGPLVNGLLQGESHVWRNGGQADDTLPSFLQPTVATVTLTERLKCPVQLVLVKVWPIEW